MLREILTRLANTLRKTGRSMNARVTLMDVYRTKGGGKGVKVLTIVDRPGRLLFVGYTCGESHSPHIDLPWKLKTPFIFGAASVVGGLSGFLSGFGGIEVSS